MTQTTTTRQIVYGTTVTLTDGRTGRVTFVDRVASNVRVVPTGCQTFESEWLPMTMIAEVNNGNRS